MVFSTGGFSPNCGARHIGKAAKKGDDMNQKKQSLVELAESLGFTRAADDDPIYTEGIVVVNTVAAEIDRLEREEASQKPPKEEK